MLANLDAQSLVSLVAEYGYVAAFPLSFLLGPTIVVIAGFLVSLGYFDPLLMFLVLLTGDLVGDTLCYLGGRWGGRGLTHRWGKFLHVVPEQVERWGRSFGRYDWKILLFGKTQVTGLPTGLALLIAAGVFGMPYARFLWLNAVGSVVKIALLEALGFYFGRSFISISDSAFGLVTLFFLLIAALFILVPLFSRRYLLKRLGEKRNDTTRDI